MTKQIIRNLTVYRDNWCLVRVETLKGDVGLIGLADLHYGHPSCNKQNVMEVIGYIKDHPNTWCILGGDLIECATRNSVGAGVYEQTLTPQDQVDEIIKLLEPIKEKCIGLIDGNHENRVFKESGINPSQTIANALDVPYCGTEGYFIIAIPDRRGAPTHRKTYTIWYGHTRKAAKTTGLELNTLERDIGKWLNVDILMKAHGHGTACIPIQYRTVSANPVGVLDHYKWLVLTGHYLERDNSYIATRGDAPKPTGTKLLHLSSNRETKRVGSEDLCVC